MDPYLQLAMMQHFGQLKGLPFSQLSPMANKVSFNDMSSQYGNSIVGSPMVDMSALAPLNLGRFGVFGSLAGIAGSAALTPMLAKAGMMPMGNAASYMHASRQMDFQNMAGRVLMESGSQDADNIYETFRGGAAMLGIAMDRDQREALHQLAAMAAEGGGQIAPQLMDMLAGPSGSVNSMASQMLSANRYQIDPITGQLGYGKTANTQLVSELFDQMYSSDNLAKMQGLRAGEMGELYTRLASEGEFGGNLNARESAINVLQDMRNSGTDLSELGAELGVDVGQNLQSLSQADLRKLTEDSRVSAKITKADVSKISEKMQEYVDSLGAIREVFGENGNPNAPMSVLLGGLQALTSGQMQKYDTTQLNSMVRDVQSLSQASGKSMDQLISMRYGFERNASGLGLETGFANTAMNVAATTGMAFSREGAASGFGAINRSEAEQLAGNLFNRGMASDFANTLGTLGRLEEAGGFTEGAAGKSLQNVLNAARRGDTEYFDERTKQLEALPTQAAQIRGMINRGAVQGVGVAGFNMMLGDTTSNRSMLFRDTGLQQAAFNNQSEEVYREISKSNQNRMSGTSSGNPMYVGLSARERTRAARALSIAGTDALRGLTAAEVSDDSLRIQVIADAILAEAGNQNLDMTEAEAKNQAAMVMGSANTVTMGMTNQSYTAFEQVQGDEVRAARMSEQRRISARSGLNQAMSNFGPKGGIGQRMLNALQKQGKRGEGANLMTFIGDSLGVDIGDAGTRLSTLMQEVNDLRKNSEDLIGSISETQSPAEQERTRKKLEENNAIIEAKESEVTEEARRLGINLDDKGFGLEDTGRAAGAYDELKALSYNVESESLAIEGFDQRLNPSMSEIKSRTEARGKDAENFEDNLASQTQIMAERRLRSIGALPEESTLMPDGYVGAVGEGMKKPDIVELSAAVKAGNIDEQLRIVDREMQRRAIEKYSGDNFAEGRSAVLAERGSADGVRRSREAGLAVERMLGLHDEFTSDPDAIKFRTAGTDAALDRSESAGDRLNTMAADFFNSDMGAMQTSGFMGVSDAGLKQFDRIRKEEEQEIRKVLRNKLGKLDNADVAAYMNTKRDRLVEEVRAANKILGANVGRGYQQQLDVTEAAKQRADKLFQGNATPEQQQQMQILMSTASLTGIDFESATEGMDLKSVIVQSSLAGRNVDTSGMTDEQRSLLEDAEGLQALSRIEKAGNLADLGHLDFYEKVPAGKAAALGITEEQYEKAIRGEKIAAVDKLRIFDDKDKLSDARTLETRFRKASSSIDKTRNEISKQTAFAENLNLSQGQREAAEATKNRLTETLQKQVSARDVLSGRRETAMGDLTEVEYRIALNHQGDIEQLDSKTKNYEEIRTQLRSAGVSDSDIEDAIKTRKVADEQAQEDANMRSRLSLTPAYDAILAAVGLGISDSPGVDKSRRSFAGSLGQGQNAAANVRMLGENLELIKSTDNLEGETTLMQLKSFQSKYAKANEAGTLSELSKAMGLNEYEMEDIYRESKFLKLNELDYDANESEQQTYIKERIRMHNSVDIASASAVEALNVTGELEITGDLIAGTGRFKDTYSKPAADLLS
jgi:hypothetical protein